MSILFESIGADHVIDYTKEDYTKTISVTSLIYDLVCNHSFSERRADPEAGRNLRHWPASADQDGTKRLVGRMVGVLYRVRSFEICERKVCDLWR